MITQPTDAEIDEFLDSPGNINWVLADKRERFRLFARAVLARWGQPAPRGAPVAWLSPWRADQVTTDYDAYGERGIPLYTALQPVGRVLPETCEWTATDTFDQTYWDSACGEAWTFIDGGPADNSVRFCQGCGKPVHIKQGGQHGAE